MKTHTRLQRPQLGLLLCLCALLTSKREALSQIVNAPTSTRTLPPVYFGGSDFSVSIDVRPLPGTLAYAVEEAPPQGWSVLEINQSGLFDSLNHKVKWGPFFDDQPRTLTFTAAPPATALGVAKFFGVASFDGARIRTTGSLNVGSVDMRAEIQAGEVVIWFVGSALWQTDDLNQPFTLVPSAVSPYRVPPPLAGRRYFKAMR